MTILQELAALTESNEYDSVLKAAYFKKRGDHYHHPMYGIVTINKHGEWEHKPHEASSPDDGFGGSTSESLSRHLKRLQTQR